ncbi:predicted protein [Plenodomus lingam JN3]|uniref:Uncharacterized protein n=1 Tax=Leptosphaeria maculans (strain JN3 / isolate v23.1.3 / race Av1-4-5-6-7-8) TaxID=985895 RepID=E4ZFT2_LEPMJ|nr:predicted protein [Plenodomus lingam JN3]CBX90152.1 predicted protein [Plenodomus lingam JN3]
MLPFESSRPFADSLPSRQPHSILYTCTHITMRNRTI